MSRLDVFLQASPVIVVNKLANVSRYANITSANVAAVAAFSWPTLAWSEAIIRSVSRRNVV